MTVYRDVAGRPPEITRSQLADGQGKLRAKILCTGTSQNGPSQIGTTQIGNFRFRGPAISLGLTLLLGMAGCQTDQTAQVKIDQMRAELLAGEARYVALRNDYEKVRRRLAAKGDPLATQTTQPSALPLVYPPGDSGLDSMPMDSLPMEGYPDDDSGYDLNSVPVPATPNSSQPGTHPAPVPTPQPAGANSVLEGDGDVRLQAPMSGVPATRASYGNRPQLAPTGSAVQSLQIDRAASHGINRDQVPGDDGIRILVQPLDAQGRLILQPADFELTLLDYSQSQNTVIGKWRFSRETIQNFMRGRRDHAGIPLQVSLKNHVLRNPEVMADIQMKTAAGQTLQVRELVPVAIDDQWVQRRAFDWNALPVPPGDQGLPQHVLAEPPITSASNPALSGFGTTPQRGSALPHEELVPTYIPADSAPEGLPPVATTPASPGWSPERR